MPSPALPHDVWLNIANYIPILVLRNLYSLNSSLFHIALDARYRQISFIYWDDRLLRNLIRLRDPYIARRVKILHMYPGFLKEVMDKEIEHKEKEKEKEREKHPSSFRVRLAQQLREFAGSRGHGEQQGSGPTSLYELPPRQSMERLRERLKTAPDVMRTVLDLLRSLHSVTEYYVTWYGLLSAEASSSPSPLPLPDTDSLSLTNLAVPCIGTPLLSPTLTKLSLDISLENIRALCTASFHVAQLEHLHLHLHSDRQISPEDHHYILHDRLAHSISNLAPFLRSLSIEAHEPMDLGPLFTGLQFMEKLDTVALALPLQRPHLGNPKALGKFLRSQTPTIKVLRLRATQHDAGSTGSSSNWRRIGTPDPWSLNSWIQTVLGSEAGGDYQEWFDEDDAPEPLGEYDLDSLESLEVSSNLLPLETALYCAERFGGKVKTLALLGSVKSFEFVKELVKVLGRCGPHNRRLSVVEEGDSDEVIWQWLTPPPVTPASPNEPLTVNINLHTLRIGPVPLSPQLLDLLAHNLQGLQHLELIVKHFLPSQDDVPIYGASRRTDGDGVQLEEQVYEFLETMQNEWVWPWWGLKTISVYSESPTLSMPLPLPLPIPSTPPNTAHHHTDSQTSTHTSLLTVPIPLSSSKGPSLSSSSASSSTTVPSHKSSASDPKTSSSVTLHGPQHPSSAPITRHPSTSNTPLGSISSSVSPLPPLPDPRLGSPRPQHRRSSQPVTPIPPVPELPVLPQLQLPLPPFHSGLGSLSTPASPVGGLLPSPASSSVGHSPIVGHSPSASAPAPGSSLAAGSSKMRVPAASVSTPALPRNFPSTSTSSNSGHAKAEPSASGSGSGRRSGSFWRAESMSNTTGGIATGKCRAMSVPHTALRDDGLGTAVAGQQQPARSHHHHMFSFLKPKPKGKLRKGKDKERERERGGGGSVTPAGLWGTLRVSNAVHDLERVEAINVALGFSHRQLEEQIREQQIAVQRKRDKQRAREGLDVGRPLPHSTIPSHSNPISDFRSDLHNNTNSLTYSTLPPPSNPPTRTRSHTGHRRHRDHWDWLDSDRDRERRRRKGKSDPSSSFGSVSSDLSRVSGISGISGLSWADSFDDGARGVGGDNKNAGGVQEERITLEVALAEVLGRCLPGVRVVR